jgi:hypothetical protein
MSMGVMALLMGAGTVSADPGPEVGLTTAIAAIDEVLQKVSPDDVAFFKLGDVQLRLVEILEGLSTR